MKRYIEPSIFASDFGKLAEEAKRCADSGADAIHVDIMDNHFVPNLTLGPKALGAINKATDLFLDVHIMVYNPYDMVERLVENGADRITFHFEATENVEEVLNYIKKCGVKTGLAFRPETSDSLVVKYLDKCDLILLMTVNPGFGGQAFMPEILDKISFTRKLCNDFDLDMQIQVDGGINLDTAKQCIDAGANNLVAGTYLFKGDMREKINTLRAL